MGEGVDLDAIVRARDSFDGQVRRTPVLGSNTLTELTGAQVVLKAENLQRTGAFKIRGAMHTLARLGERARRGVTAGSAGNHALALAFAARHHGVGCHLYVPAGAPITKIDTCEELGAIVTEVPGSLEQAVTAAIDHAAGSGSVFCHPFDHPDVVAGQGTLGLELIEQIPDLGLVVVPLGGGGLAAGTAIAVKQQQPRVRIIGVQARVCAPYAGAPAPDGPVVTLADGIAVKSSGEVTGPLVQRWLDDVVTVDEDAIADAMVLLMERAKLYVEGAGAVAVAALLHGAVRPRDDDGVTCAVLSGGNVDLGVVPGLIRRHETSAGRRLSVFARIDDRPGRLVQLLGVFADGGANLIEVDHVREGIELHVRETGVRLTFEVRGRTHAQRILATAATAGYELHAAFTDAGLPTGR